MNDVQSTTPHVFFVIDGWFWCSCCVLCIGFVRVLFVVVCNVTHVVGVCVSV